ncbi:membrane protein insertase YidC [Falsirhodobacter halotolerans]|uniref:membrane protein insertase YidC n=1 Tax=Falsirhodobacter halotolerans TaxID=1146892 RepID=UPI001FD5E703|nr:membrane protein insertase YidC [Falsirhodobacter halotolerans]MCJ8138560.1 membrane protein insertase YidC [Falsirhodobacter halotolerans]
MENPKNLVLAIVLSLLVMLGWFWLFPPEQQANNPDQPDQVSTTADQPMTQQGDPAGGEVAPVAAEAPRITIDTPELSGSISTIGARLDDLLLKSYRVTLAEDSPNVRLLTPVGEDRAYYALQGWVPGGGLDYPDVPGPDTQWQVQGAGTLTADTPVTLQWQSPAGLLFTRTIAVDEQYMFTVTDQVQNTGDAEQRLAPYGMIARHGLPVDLQGFFVLHEGVVGRVDGELIETKYKAVRDLPAAPRESGLVATREATTDGWIGFTDHYWMTTLIPQEETPFTAVEKYLPQSDIYTTETRQPLMTVAPGATIETSSRVFAGAKEWATIRHYQNDEGVAGFIDSIDWGWFFFLTKPIFAVLHWLNAHIGNMGLAIIALTFILKALVLPLAYKSYVSMARMKELQPEMEALKERAGDDRQKLQKEIMTLYREKKVNPAAGCLPILLQIPIFFSLYKVILVTIELRHAPFFGWLQDLSAPDPSSLFNLFGLLPWAAPEHGSILALIFIGVLPILLGISMWLQQKLNPAPTDPTQQMIFAWMPWVFMFMLGSFASGLVLYWITNNLITFTQQYIIMASHGKRPDLFDNIRASFRKKPKPVAAPEKTMPAKKGKSTK